MFPGPIVGALYFLFSSRIQRGLYVCCLCESNRARTNWENTRKSLDVTALRVLLLLMQRVRTFTEYCGVLGTLCLLGVDLAEGI